MSQQRLLVIADTSMTICEERTSERRTFSCTTRFGVGLGGHSCNPPAIKLLHLVSGNAIHSLPNEVSSSNQDVICPTIFDVNEAHHDICNHKTIHDIFHGVPFAFLHLI